MKLVPRTPPHYIHRWGKMKGVTWGVRKMKGVTWGVRLQTWRAELLQQSYCLRLGEGACCESVEVEATRKPRSIPRHTVRAGAQGLIDEPLQVKPRPPP